MASVSCTSSTKIRTSGEDISDEENSQNANTSVSLYHSHFADLEYPRICRCYSNVRRRKSTSVLLRVQPYSLPHKIKLQDIEIVPKIDFVGFSRRMTPIDEEVFHYKRHSSFPKLAKSHKAKAHTEKVTSLKLVINRLQEMCVSKPEMLQIKAPEEITDQFSKIKI